MDISHENYRYHLLIYIDEIMQQVNYAQLAAIGYNTARNSDKDDSVAKSFSNAQSSFSNKLPVI